MSCRRRVVITALQCLAAVGLTAPTVAWAKDTGLKALARVLEGIEVSEVGFDYEDRLPPEKREEILSAAREAVAKNKHLKQTKRQGDKVAWTCPDTGLRVVEHLTSEGELIFTAIKGKADKGTILTRLKLYPDKRMKLQARYSNSTTYKSLKEYVPRKTRWAKYTGRLR